MADSPDAHAFQVVTAPTGTSGAEFKNVAQVVAGVDTLDAFLKEMRKRYPDAVAAPPEGLAEKAAAPKPAPAPSTPARADKPEAKKAVLEKAAANAPAKPHAATAPLPPKSPAGAADPAPTGSILPASR